MHELKFGRIGHDAKGATRWTHASDGLLGSGVQARFVAAEVWAPSWIACERTDHAPDLYLCISNRLGLGPDTNTRRPLFESLCIFAIANDLESRAQDRGREAALSLAVLLSPVLGVRKVRAWGRSGEGGFADALNDMHLCEPFRPPIRQEDHLRATLEADGWNIFSDTAG